MMRIIKTYLYALLGMGLLLPTVVGAQGLSLTVTPTLFDMSAVPQQSWDSQIKVVNNNSFPLTIYAKPLNFIPQGERGHSAFLPVLETTGDGQTLAEWMTVPSEAITIPAEQSATIPVNIAVPADASPGGHYAAVLIGTQPPDTDGTVAVKTSQLISSLFFLRIAGDVVEDASIRTFRPLERWSAVPEQTLELRFQNDGNVHLRPEGRIVISNMWGKERGVIPVNYKTNFGNVLPESTRQYEFTWQGENVITDFGRYTATLTLGYGADERQFLTRSTHFWIVPLRPLLISFGVLIFLIWFVRRTIKAYVRYMLRLSGIDPDAPVHVNASGAARVSLQGDVRIARSPSIQEPVRAGWFDLTERWRQAEAFGQQLLALGRFVVAYRVFFGSLLVGVVLVLIIVWYVSDVTTERRDYEVRVETAAGTTVISSEAELVTTEAPENEVINSQYRIDVINVSREPGTAAAVVERLHRAGYAVSDVRADLAEVRDASVIVYHPDVQAEAVALREVLGDVTLSVFAGTGEPSLTVLVGNDLLRNERDIIQ